MVHSLILYFPGIKHRFVRIFPTTVRTLYEVNRPDSPCFREREKRARNGDLLLSFSFFRKTSDLLFLRWPFIDLIAPAPKTAGILKQLQCAKCY